MSSNNVFSKFIVYTKTPAPFAAHASATQDRGLSVKSLGILSYVLHNRRNLEQDKSPVKTCVARFGKADNWWSRSLKELEALGYVAWERVSKKGRLYFTYVFSDDNIYLQSILQILQFLWKL